MSDLSAAAAAMGIPEPIAERSARARAEATGQTYEEVLAAWAGGQPVASAAAASEPASAEPPSDAEADAPETAVAPETAAAPPDPRADREDIAPAPAAVAPSPTPERVSVSEAMEYPVVVTVPTAGITERTGFNMPTWLGALLLIIPAFGLLYLAMGASAECGSGTELGIDRVTGELINCDGTAFEGRGPAGGGTDFIAAGEALFPTCAGCHGAQGQGQGTFPALTGVFTTFGACADHIEWVTLGSGGFSGTYGDVNKPVQGGMPAFGSSLTEEQIASVVAFERVRFGGGNPDDVLADCGLVEAEGGEEGGDEGGEEGTDGTAPETTTAPEAALTP
ncbi:MAG TPA: cytochrome c [Acidimicrobiia bacterium]|nr:cytochrome c [Acidimicrobiia bacterium]